ncbi:MAG: hypothetical protein RMK34_05055 [Tepidimonas sp.]|uniref:hypothetical protein n=1 Tax=Tepidimonas sp. TaxID=2002775 RepID=UPI00298F2234|nr:hypothetical protein [Tepidimonas sp.]MDW8336321.1 hypothetical protein [Tepidimonas sp.]
MPAVFEREITASLDEWQRLLRLGVGDARLHAQDDAAQVIWAGGRLRLTWQALPARALAGLRLPRLRVRFVFEMAEPAQRAAFMAAFDQRTRRGGG